MPVGVAPQPRTVCAAAETVGLAGDFRVHTRTATGVASLRKDFCFGTEDAQNKELPALISCSKSYIASHLK